MKCDKINQSAIVDSNLAPRCHVHHKANSIKRNVVFDSAPFGAITGSAVALHCCKAHSKSIGKMENSTPCKIVTPENFILKLGIRD